MKILINTYTWGNWKTSKEETTWSPVDICEDNIKMDLKEMGVRM
jgi:hypothetical protein